MFTAITLSRMMLRWVVRQPWARKASYFGVGEDEFAVADRRAAVRARSAPVFDLIGKRRWFYLFSLADHDPGAHLHPADAR